jgi:AraC family transcriptional regulator
VHFARLFKQAFGMPVHQFILQSRIDSARLKLVSNSCSLAEIASECGFSSQAHFSSAFRRFVGTSPGDFRTARRR